MIKTISNENNDIKDQLEDLEQYILSTSETINEKVEEIHKQLNDLHVEIRANIDLVMQKCKIN